MTAGENPDIQKKSDLTAGSESTASDGAKESKVDTTQTRQAGKNPNKAEAPVKSSGAPANKPSEAENKGGFAELTQFLSESWVEFRKISWPTREQVIQETWSVIVLVAVFTATVLAFDWAVAKVVFEPLDKFAKQVGGGVGRTMQSWGPLNQPAAPVNQPGSPGNQPASPASSPAGKLNPAPTPAPSNQPAPAPVNQQTAPSGQTAPAAPPAGQPGGTK